MFAGKDELCEKDYLHLAKQKEVKVEKEWIGAKLIMMTFVYYTTSYLFDAFSFPEAKFLGSYGGDIFDFGIGVVIPDRQATYRLECRYDDPMLESAISPSQGL
jgi:hypothetical protein